MPQVSLRTHKLHSILSARRNPTNVPSDPTSRPDIFTLPPEILDRIFYFLFKNLRIHLLPWSKYPTSESSTNSKLKPKPPKWSPRKLESVPMLRVRKVRHQEVRTALLRHATVIVFHRIIIENLVFENTILATIIRKICIFPPMVQSLASIKTVLAALPNLRSITFPLCDKDEDYCWARNGTKLTPWVCCHKGKCKVLVYPPLIRHFLDRTEPADWADDITHFRSVEDWRDAIEGSGRTPDIDLSLEVNMFVKASGFRWALWNTSVWFDDVDSIRGCLRHCIRLGWVVVKTNTDLKDGIMRFELGGYQYSCKTRRPCQSCGGPI